MAPKGPFIVGKRIGVKPDLNEKVSLIKREEKREVMS